VAAIMTEAGPRHRGTCPGAHGPPDRPPRLPGHVADDGRPLQVHWRQGLLPMLHVLAGIGQSHRPRPQRAAQHAHLVWGAERASQQANGLEPWPPLAVVDSTLRPPRDLLHRWRIDQPHLNAPARQELKPRTPRDPSRFQGHGRDPARGPPVGQALSIDRVRATAAHRLGVVTGGHRHNMRFGPHVNACGPQVDGGQLGWERGLGARRLRRAVGHGRLRQHRAPRERQWGQERRRCSPLPHGIRSRPVTTGVATGSRDQPHQRAHRTIGPTASHGPLPRPE
jgi:hypothetical protein